MNVAAPPADAAMRDAEAKVNKAMMASASSAVAEKKKEGATGEGVHVAVTGASASPPQRYEYTPTPYYCLERDVLYPVYRLGIVHLPLPEKELHKETVEVEKQTEESSGVTGAVDDVKEGGEGEETPSGGDPQPAEKEGDDGTAVAAHDGTDAPQPSQEEREGGEGEGTAAASTGDDPVRVPGGFHGLTERHIKLFLYKKSIDGSFISAQDVWKGGDNDAKSFYIYLNAVVA